MKRKYWKTSRHSGGASRKSSKTTAWGRIPPLSEAATGTIDGYWEELKNMPDDKNALIEFLHKHCTEEQLENMKAAQMTTKRKIIEDFIRKNFRGIPRIDILISPDDPLFSHRDDPQAMEPYVKANFLNDAGRRDLIRAQAKMAAENRKLRDKYFDMLRHVIVEMPFEDFSYRLACVFSPMSADDFAIAEYLNGVNLYLQNTQVTLWVVNPFQEEEPDFFFTEDELLSWIDEIESSIEVTESAAS